MEQFWNLGAAFKALPAPTSMEQGDFFRMISVISMIWSQSIQQPGDAVGPQAWQTLQQNICSSLQI